MDLTHEGYRYKLIEIQTEELEELNPEEKFSDSDRYILDCRNIKPEDILSKLTAFYHQIKCSKVSFVWINCSEGKFLEIKERLVKLLAENNELSRGLGNHAVLKLTTQDRTTPVMDTLKISIDVLNFGKSSLDDKYQEDFFQNL